MRVRIITAISTLFVLFFFACNKEGKFLGTTDFNSQIQLFSYAEGEDAYVKIQIGDTTINKLDITTGEELGSILTYVINTPANSQTKLKIWWRNTNEVIADTTVNIGAITKLYLIQFDPTQAPQFYASFGGDGAAPLDPNKVSVRVLYTKDTALNYPDTIQIKLAALFSSQGDYKATDSLHRDTVVLTVVNGIPSEYVELYDFSVSIKDSATAISSNISYGYEIYKYNADPNATPVRLESFCYSAFPINIADFGSAASGHLQTFRLGFVPQELGYKCGNTGNPSPAANYDLDLLFGSPQ